MNILTIDVANDFDQLPFGRYKPTHPEAEDTSGELFRETFLIPNLNKYDKIVVDFTTCLREIHSGFLEEAFGGLIRKLGADPIKKIEVKPLSNLMGHEIQKYIDDAIASQQSKSA